MTLPCTRDPEAWFSDHAAGVHKAKTICNTECTNTAACLTWAVANNEAFGVWGGTTVGERRPLVRAAGTGGRRAETVPERAHLYQPRFCEVPGCGRRHSTKGMCRSHYMKGLRAAQRAKAAA